MRFNPTKNEKSEAGVYVVLVFMPGDDILS
jgi:hypothetical protein